MTGDGFRVDTAALRRYGDSLAARTAHADETLDLVRQSDVGHESWGVVGLFVKEDYSAMLADLQELLRAMRDGLSSGADKAKRSADAYQALEGSSARIFQDAARELGEEE